MTVRNMDERLKTQLRLRAAIHGRSMEEEAREILRAALSTTGDPAPNLAEAIRRRIGPLGGVTLDISPREPVRDPGIR